MSDNSTDSASTITMFGADWCSDCRRAKAVLDREGVAYEYIDTEAVEDAASRAKAVSGRNNIPVIVFPDGSHLVEPSNPELLAKLQTL